MWDWLLYVMTAASAEPGALAVEAPRASAAVAAARASMTLDAPGPTPPAPACVCGGTCRNGKWKPDGRIEQPCPCPRSCKCKCPDGRCGAPSASPATVSPARPIGGR